MQDITSNYIRFTNEGERIVLGYDLSENQIERRLKQVKQDSNYKSKYYSYLLSPEWQVLRKLVLKRANGICEVCKISAIEATHHKTSKRFGHEYLSDLLGVCDACHKKIHKIENKQLAPLVFGGEV